MNDIEILERPTLTDECLNELFAVAWNSNTHRAFAQVFERSLTYFAAFDAQHLVGFVNVAWDGGAHAFVLDPTVHPHAQRQGLGSQLVRRAVAAAADHGVEWVHVDYEPHHRPFYAALGFRVTDAGVLRTQTPKVPGPARGLLTRVAGDTATGGQT